MTTVIDEFVALVREYVELIDRAGSTAAHPFLQACARVLPRIYATGLDLPNVEPGDDDAAPVIASPLTRVKSLLGRYDSYSEVFDPYVDEPPVVGSLADDLADVYLDLARPLEAFDAGRTADALWEWRFNLLRHCGDHLVDAMRTIHRAVNSHMPPEYIAGSETAG